MLNFILGGCVWFYFIHWPKWKKTNLHPYWWCDFISTNRASTIFLTGSAEPAISWLGRCNSIFLQAWKIHVLWFLVTGWLLVWIATVLLSSALLFLSHFADITIPGATRGMDASARPLNLKRWKVSNTVFWPLRRTEKTVYFLRGEELREQMGQNMLWITNGSVNLILIYVSSVVLALFVK